MSSGVPRYHPVSWGNKTRPMLGHLYTPDTFLINKESKNNEKYKTLCLQGQLLLNHEIEKLNCVFSSKRFSTKNPKIMKNKNTFCLQSL